MISVRPAAADDISAVISLAASVPEAPQWSRAVYEGFCSKLDSAKQLFVAESDGGIVAFLACQIVAGTCELQSIVVEASARRRGIGRTLFATFVEWLHGICIARVELEVRAGNSTAIIFYAHAGFRRDGLRRAYYQRPEEDAVLMSMTLGSA